LLLFVRVKIRPEKGGDDTGGGRGMRPKRDSGRSARANMHKGFSSQERGDFYAFTGHLRRNERDWRRLIKSRKKGSRGAEKNEEAPMC